jgi:HSP20 family protein
MDLPGLQKEDLNLLLEAGQLTVSGRRPSYQDEAHKYHLKETFSGEFTRTFTLPKGVDAEKVSAQVQDGVLVIQIPKRNEVKPRKIEIAAA